MAKATVLRLRRGTTAEHTSFTGAQSEVTHNTSTGRLHLHDGTTQGGIPLARLDELPEGGGDGTVTSVDLSAPDGFEVSGQPVTGSGTLTFTFANGYQAFTTAESERLELLDPSKVMQLETTIDYGTLTDV